MTKAMLVTAVLALTLPGIEARAGEPPPGPGLGHAVTPAERAKWGGLILPDGTGLPPGGGTVEQGAHLYAQLCVSCHGRDGLGDSADQLAGARMALTSDWPEKTIGTYWPNAPMLFDFIRRSMPMERPGTLTNDEVYALTAYLLELNGIIGAHDRLDAAALARIRMPNRDGFIDMSRDR